MNEELKHSLQQIAADNIGDDVNLWPGVRWHLRSQPPRQLRQQQQLRTPGRWRVVSIGAAVAVLLFAVTLVVSPPARAWSYGVVDQLFARFGFAREDAPQTPDNIRLPGLTEGQIQKTIQCYGTDLRISTTNPAGFTLTRDIAQEQVDFTIKLPAYLPQGYCGINHFDVYADQQAVVYTAWGFRDQLTFAQLPATSEPPAALGITDIGAAPAAQVAVNGYEGLWIEGAPSGTGWFYQKPVPNPSAGAPSVEEGVHIVPENILTWEQNGVRYQLRGSLSYYEMQLIAESLQ